MRNDLFNLFWKIKLFSPKGVFVIISSLFRIGINLLSILRIASKLYPHKTALNFENETYTYKQLYQKANCLKFTLYKEYNLRAKQKIAFFCSNHSAFAFSLFASAGLGLDIYLLSNDVSTERFIKLINQYQFDFIIYDNNIEDLIINIGYKEKSINSNRIYQYLDIEVPLDVKIPKGNFNKIIVLTSGTSGISSPISRRTSLLPYLRPFLSIVLKLKIWDYRSLFIATPIYHGFGFVALLMSFGLGKEVYIRRKFETAEICNLINDSQIEAIALVPTMLQRMIYQNTSALKSLRCIISGGAMLPPSLVLQTQKHLGNYLFNLYGTTEAGVSIMANPSDLSHNQKTVGKPLSGVDIRITNNKNEDVEPNTIGQILLRCQWSATPSKWVDTGDLGYMDNQGYYYIAGRADDMIISGGENVFPSELEDILREHPNIYDVAVVGINDNDFGQRLKAFVVLQENIKLTEHEIRIWLSRRTSKHQVPKVIEITDQIPTNSIQKVDRKRLN